MPRARGRRRQPCLLRPDWARKLIDPAEAGFIDFINKATVDRLQAQFPPGTEPVLRDAHPKTHVLVRAEFIVLADLPEQLRYGIFKEARTYDALIRFSAGGIEVQADTVPQANGMAIKLLGVEGEKILENEKDAKTQDFVMINNFPSFFVRNLADYQSVHEALEMGDDPTYGTRAFFEAHPEELRAVLAMRGDQPLGSPFQARYWSQTPIMLGAQAIKFSAAPISAIAPGTYDTSGPDFLREVALEQIGQQDVYFDFLVQVQTDPEAMPVEDSLVVWDEALSPFQRVAIIRIPKQEIDVATNQELGEALVVQSLAFASRSSPDRCDQPGAQGHLRDPVGISPWQERRGAPGAYRTPARVKVASCHEIAPQATNAPFCRIACHLRGRNSRPRPG